MFLLIFSLGVKWPEREADLSLLSSARKLRIRGSCPLLPHTISGLQRNKYNFFLKLQQTTVSALEQPKLSSSGYGHYERAQFQNLGSESSKTVEWTSMMVAPFGPEHQGKI